MKRGVILTPKKLTQIGCPHCQAILSYGLDELGANAVLECYSCEGEFLNPHHHPQPGAPESHPFSGRLV